MKLKLQVMRHFALHSVEFLFLFFFVFCFPPVNRIRFSESIFKHMCKTAAFSSQLQL